MSVVLHSGGILGFCIAQGLSSTAVPTQTRTICSGKFGPMCSLTCGHCVDDEPCHQDTGVCLRGCQDGFTGHSCKETLDSTSPFQAGLAGGVVMVVAVLVIAAIVVGAHYLWKKRQRSRENGNLESGSPPSKAKVSTRILSVFRKGSDNRNTYVDEELVKGARGQNTTDTKQKSEMTSTQPKTVAFADEAGANSVEDKSAQKGSTQAKAAPVAADDMYEVPVTPDNLKVDMNVDMPGDHNVEDSEGKVEDPTQDTWYDVPPPPLPFTEDIYLNVGNTEDVDDAASRSDDSSYEIPVSSLTGQNQA
ncbi:uncharacterized protein LOC124279862 [Haliotis rubra]|uniref:uncharacterized protein LOC124279862 n=1 Tax=Haliotis rubra TaxID=36100 RepID=UPI001EE5603E|nr:uncharacterized protein LOC124279862 [Haliotis rubra]